MVVLELEAVVMSLLEVCSVTLALATGLAFFVWTTPARLIWARLVAVFLLLTLALAYVGVRLRSLPLLYMTFASIWPFIFFSFELGLII